MGSMRDKAEGKGDQVKGKLKEELGDLTDDESLEAEGHKDQAKGKAKEAMGDVKDAARKAKESVEEAVE